MSLDYTKIENKFADYILNLLGPNEELDKQREEKFNFIKTLIIKSLKVEYPDLTPHIYCFGSFPLKTYLNDSDLDITILFEEKSKGSFILNYSFDFQNKILLLIQTTFESYNNETSTQTFTDVNLIFADIKLIKCKYGNLSIDMSINNFVGLSKIVFMNLVEKKFGEKFQNDLIFKRTLIIIKAWSYYEGGILGSNISLMANYAFEVLVIYLFNNYSHLFKTEVEAFFTFLKILKEFDWDSNILHLFGSLSISNFTEKAKVCEETNSTDPLWYLTMNSLDNLFSNLIINAEDFSEFVRPYEKFKDLDKTQYFNTSKRCITLKYMNIIDPMYNNNNLGKSVNFHNFSKIKKVIEFTYNDMENIILSRTNIISDPFMYLNSLLKLFSKSLTSNFSELFFFTLPKPKIIINPYLNMYDESITKNISTSNRKNSDDYLNTIQHGRNSNFSSLNNNMIVNFNKLFKGIITGDVFSSFKKIEESKSYNSGSDNSMSDIYVTKDILDFIIKNENLTQINPINPYKYPFFYDIELINEFLNKL